MKSDYEYFIHQTEDNRIYHYIIKLDDLGKAQSGVYNQDGDIGDIQELGAMFNSTLREMYEVFRMNRLFQKQDIYE